MYIGDFSVKLRKCNPSLYIKQGETTAFIYHRSPEHWDKVSLSNLTNYDVVSRVDELNRGQLDRQICRIPKDFIPESTIYEIDRDSHPLQKKNHRIGVRGLRDTLKIILDLKLISKQQISRHFGISSIGEYTWDKLSMEQRIDQLLKDERTRL